MPSYADDYRSSRSSRHGDTLYSSSSHRPYDDRAPYEEPRRRPSPDVWRRPETDAYDRDERRSGYRLSSSSSGQYAYNDSRESRRYDDEERRSRQSYDRYDQHRATYDDDHRARPRSPYRSSRDHTDRDIYSSSRDRRYETDRDTRRESDRDRRYDSEWDRKYDRERDRTYDSEWDRKYDSERDRRRSRDLDSDRREHRRYSGSARSRSRERQRDYERPRDKDRLSGRRSSRDGDSLDSHAKPVLLKRKPGSVSKPANGAPLDEDDKLEMMLNASKRSNGTHSATDRIDRPASPETARWKKLNGDSSSLQTTQAHPANGHDKHHSSTCRGQVSASTASPASSEKTSQPVQLSFGRVELPHELPLEVRQKNSMASAPYQEGVKVVLKTAREKGVVDAKTIEPRSGKKPNRLFRTTLHPIRFVWDKNSVGKKPPPPPRTVVLTNLSALTKVGTLLNRFRMFGRVETHKLEMDPKIGQSLGICSVTYAHDFDEQGKVLGNVASNVTPQNGAKIAKLACQALDGTVVDQVRITALLDREGEVLKEQIKAKLAASAAKLRPTQAAAAAKTPASDSKASSPLPSPSAAARGSGTPASSSKYSMAPPDVPRSSRPSSSLYSSSRPGRYDSPTTAARSSLRYDDAWRSGSGRDSRDDDRRYSRSSYDRNVASPLSARRSDDYDRRRPSHSSLREDVDSSYRSSSDKEDTRDIMERLLKLKHPYVFISQPRSSDIETRDIHTAMSQVQPAWISQGDAGWYVAFDDRNGAHGCKIVTETLTVRGYRLSVEVRTPTELESLRETGPKTAAAPATLAGKYAAKSERSTYDTGIAVVSKDELHKTSWTEAELQDAVFRMVQKDLAEVFMRDVKSRIVSPHITQYLKPTNEGGRILAKASVKKVVTAVPSDAPTRSFDAKTSLPSFRKLVSAKSASRPEVTKASSVAATKGSKSKLGSKLLDGDEHSKKSASTKRSGKLLRKEAMRLDWTDDESDMDEESTEQEADSRSVSASVEPPSTDGTSIHDLDEIAVDKTKKAKAATKKSVKKVKPAAPAKKAKAPPKVKAVPKLDPFEAGVVEDAEDLFYLKLALQRLQLGEPISEDMWVDEALERQLADESTEGPAKHQTDSARTEGYYVIPAAQKAIHLPDRNKATEKEEEAHVLQSARNNRADSRRLVLGFEQHKRETATDTDMFKFNQLRTRKKQLKFAKSPIHDWGLYAMELIPAGDMVIEYVGEMVRQQVADEREKQYERQGNFSTYLFRVDDDLVVDATHKGNIARLMNHCCTPNCNAKILTLNGEKRIVLFAKDPIRAGEELTYDYKFQSSGDDEDAIACLCGSSGCRRFL